MIAFADLKVNTTDRVSYRVFQLNDDRYLVVTRKDDVESVEGHYGPVEADAKLDELLGRHGHTDCQEWPEGVVFKTFANLPEQPEEDTSEQPRSGWNRSGDYATGGVVQIKDSNADVVERLGRIEEAIYAASGGRAAWELVNRRSPDVNL